MRLADALRETFKLDQVIAAGAGIVVIIVVSWGLYLLLKRAMKGALAAAGSRIAEEAQRQRATTLVLLLGSVMKYVIIFLAAIMILGRLGLDLTPILAGAGVVGLAVGFGAQNLVRDVVSGFFIIMEGQYAVGDLVEINGVMGKVEEVGLRVTKIRDATGQLRYFPNGAITAVSNYTEDHVAYVVTVPVGAVAEPERVVSSVFEEFDREFGVFAGPPVVRPAEQLGSYGRVVKAEVRAIPGRQGLLEQKLPARVAARLERVGHPLPTGTEVSVTLKFPPPVSKA